MCKECICTKEVCAMLKGYCVCHTHKVIRFQKQIPSNAGEIIGNYLKKVQTAIEENEAKYYNIENKHINGVTLSDEEHIIRNNLLEFNDIRNELEFLLSKCTSVFDERIKALLYRLLMLSDWISRTYGISD